MAYEQCRTLEYGISTICGHVEKTGFTQSLRISPTNLGADTVPHSCIEAPGAMLKLEGYRAVFPNIAHHTDIHSTSHSIPPRYIVFLFWPITRSCLIHRLLHNFMLLNRMAHRKIWLVKKKDRRDGSEPTSQSSFQTLPMPTAILRIRIGLSVIRWLVPSYTSQEALTPDMFTNSK